MSNSVDPAETAHDEPSHLDLCCLQKPIMITCGSERVKAVACGCLRVLLSQYIEAGTR